MLTFFNGLLNGQNHRNRSMNNADKSECRCQYCNASLTFEAERVGETVVCPNCQMETRLYAPSRSAEKPPSKTQFKFLIAGAVISALVTSAIFTKGFGLLSKRSHDQPPISTPKTAAESAPTRVSKRTPEETVKHYLKASQWEQRLEFVRNVEQVRPLMERRYKDVKLPAAFVETKKAENLKDNWVFVPVVFARGKNAFGVEVEDLRVYYLRRTESEFKIDWESSVIFNPMSWVEFKLTLPQQPQKFRFLAKLDEIYPYQRRDRGKLEDTYWSVGIIGVDGNRQREFVGLHGYVLKSTSDGAKLFSLLRDGKEHPVTCLVRVPMAGNGAVKDEHLFYDTQLRRVMIDKLVSDSWIEE